MRADFAALAAAPGVQVVGGPWTHLYGLLDVDGGGSEDLTVEIREPGRSPVDQPLLTAGSWLAAGDDGVVLEDGLADTIGVGPGDTISVVASGQGEGQSLRVRGAAMTVSRGRFPLSRPALIVAAFAARDSARNHATLRAVGATPRQTVAMLVVSQLGASLLAVALGLPLGLGMWRLMDGGDLPPVDVAATTLLAIAATVPVAFAALVSLPALRNAHRPPAPALALAYE